MYGYVRMSTEPINGRIFAKKILNAKTVVLRSGLSFVTDTYLFSASKHLSICSFSGGVVNRLTTTRAMIEAGRA